MYLQRFAAVALVLSLVGASLAAHAQSSPDVDWASVLAAETDPRVSIDPSCGPDLRNPDWTLCVTITSAPPPNMGYAMTDVVSYGDLVGDGQTDAVIPLDSGGTAGVSGFLLYRLADAGPELVDVQTGYGSPSINPDTHTLDVLIKGPGPNCCPTSMDRISYTLVGDHLVEQGQCTYVPNPQDLRVPQGPCTPVSGSPAGSPAPGPDFSGLRAFPGPVLVPPSDLQPFATLPFLDARVYTGGLSNQPSYSVSFGETGIGGNGAGIDGSMTSAQYDMDNKPWDGCPATAAYCYLPPDPAHRQGDADEFFHSVQARGANAVVSHVTFPSEIWKVTWFDKAAGVTYRLSVAGDPISAFAAPGTFSQNNLSGAQRLAMLADKLVKWSGS